VYIHTQEDLVQLAFAGPDLEEDFAAYKKQTIDDELGIDEKKNKILSEGEFGSFPSILSFGIF
jgi:U3 small nucleolar RNA-associated protein 14